MCRLQCKLYQIKCTLSNLLNNLVEGIIKMDKAIKNVKLPELNTKIMNTFLNIQTLKII